MMNSVHRDQFRAGDVEGVDHRVIAGTIRSIGVEVARLNVPGELFLLAQGVELETGTQAGGCGTVLSAKRIERDQSGRGDP